MLRLVSSGLERKKQNLIALSVTHGAMAVSYGSENPERALMVYDLLRNDAECYDLINYGQKGVQWDVNDEGLRTVPESYNSDTDGPSQLTSGGDVTIC